MNGIERRCPDCGKSITVPRQDDLSWRTVERWVAEHPAHCSAATGLSALKAEAEARSIRAMSNATASNAELIAELRNRAHDQRDALNISLAELLNRAADTIAMRDLGGADDARTEADVRADQIEKDAAIAQGHGIIGRDLEPYWLGVDDAAEKITAAILAQAVSPTP